MKVIIQRVKESSVEVNNQIIGKINKGYCILVGFSKNDTPDKIPKLADKILKLRIFDDENHNLNKSIQDINGSILLISNFTLYADCTKGNRPSFGESLNYTEAKKMYEELVKEFKKTIKTETGEFGADMIIKIENDGPVTVEIEL